MGTGKLNQRKVTSCPFYLEIIPRSSVNYWFVRFDLTFILSLSESFLFHPRKTGSQSKRLCHCFASTIDNCSKTLGWYCVCVNISIDCKHLFETFQNRTSSEPSDGLDSGVTAHLCCVLFLHLHVHGHGTC